jgi:ribonuclease VapC
MIVVDTSALIAIMREEPERDAFLELIINSPPALISAAAVLECSIVLRGFKVLSSDAAEEALDSLLSTADIRMEPVDGDILRVARLAHIRFGKGTGHPAQLNFGDCFSYALAKALDAPLLFKGEDFARTDIASAMDAPR